MNKEFIPTQQASELKALGYPKDGAFGLLYKETDMSAILYQQAFRWFREKYDLHAYVDSMRLTTGETVYSYVIEITDGEESDGGKNWRTYEEAEIACLKKLIEIVKNY
jgi:hypothetical protein